MQDYSFPSNATSPAAPASDANTGNVVLNGTASNTTAATLPPTVGFEHRGLTSRDWAIGVGLLVVCSVVFFLIRGFITSMLVDRRAAPDAARGAGWAVFVFLFCTAAAVIFGLLGDYWGKFLYLLPALVLMVVTGLLALVMVLRAGGARR
ncbi:MAG: hypothetical protein INR64_12165 [Caulobacteraceae bacterium]|nr:hypothetical protein [Caulobacter sp.]